MASVRASIQVLQSCARQVIVQAKIWKRNRREILSERASDRAARHTGEMEAGNGVLGPESVAWELHASPAMLTAGLRALLLQLWHPSIASAVAAHSEVARDPWRRYQATVAFVASVTYGDADEADAAVRRVRGRARHGARRRRRRRALHGQRSRRSSPTCTRRSSTARSARPTCTARRCRPRIAIATCPRWHASPSCSASTTRRATPRQAERRDHDERRRRGESRPGRDLAWLLALPPLPFWMRPPYGVLFASAVDLLPRECAVDLGLLPVWSPARPAVRASNTALLTAATYAVGWRPARRALRSIARRRTEPA